MKCRMHLWFLSYIPSIAYNKAAIKNGTYAEFWWVYLIIFFLNEQTVCSSIVGDDRPQ
jgi:hypothetical protein